MQTEIDEAKMQELAGKVLGDVAGAMGVLMAFLGDQAGVYKALESHGPITAQALAEELGMEPKYVREWLGSNAAGGYVSYDAQAETFWLSPEQALIFAREGEEGCIQGLFESVVGQFETHDEALDVFRTGRGRPWSGQAPRCVCAVDRFFRPGYKAHLMEDWVPAIDGLGEKLKSGARVADIACGLGTSTIMMAQAYPDSTFHGFDFHEESIETAANAHRPPVSAMSNFTCPWRRILPATASTSPASSMRFTIWATRSAPRAMCARH